MPVRKQVSCLSHSTVRLPWRVYHPSVSPLYACPEDVSSFSQSTIHQSGNAYRPLVSSQYSCPETRIVLESVHCMSVWEGTLSLSHSTICPWNQSTIYLSGSSYHPSLNSLYVCLRARTILESFHCIPVPARGPPLSQSIVCLSGRTYHPRVSSLYVSSGGRIIPESVHYMPVQEPAPPLSQSNICLF